MRISIAKLTLLVITIAISSGSVISNRTRVSSDEMHTSNNWVIEPHSGTSGTPQSIIEKKLPQPPQLKKRHTFGAELPDDKSGWVESGEAFSWWKKVGWTSINPATGKRREHLKLCQKHKEHKIPDDAECCRNDVFWCWCRTYKKIKNWDAINATLRGVTTVLNGSGRIVVEG